MARIELTRGEVERRDLPFVRVKCGRPAELWKDKWFDWQSGKSAALRMLGPVPAGPTIMKAQLPVCRWHRNHWRWRSVIGWGVGGVVVASFLIGLAAVAEAEQIPRAWLNVFGGLFCFGSLGALLWIPTMLVLINTAVRPVAITKDRLTLAGVSPTFVEKLKEHGRLSPEERQANQNRGADPEE